MNSTLQKRASALTFTAYEDQTLLTEQLSIAPLKIVNIKPINNTNICMLTNYGGGFVGGDEIALEICCNPKTTSLISSQANTRIYESNGELCQQKLSFTLKEDAVHVFFNDPLVMHKGSSFFQETTVAMDDRSVLVFVDWFSSGRTENQESFSFHSFTSETKVIKNETPVIWDRFQIRPEEMDIHSPGMFSDHTSFLNVFIVGNQELDAIQFVEKHLFQHCPSVMTPEMKGNFSRTQSDVLIGRFSATTTMKLQTIIQEIADAVSHPKILAYHPLEQKY